MEIGLRNKLDKLKLNGESEKNAKTSMPCVFAF